MWDSADYELAWPKRIFIHELEALAAHPYRPLQSGELDWLLAEAFVSDQPRRSYKSARYQFKDDNFVSDLLGHCNDLREHSSLRPYWPRRHAADRSPAVDRAVVYRRFSNVIEELRRDGYFDRELFTLCPDDENPTRVAVDVAGVLAERLGQDRLWPLAPETWDDDTFYGLVEVFYDLVARPRAAEACEAAGCIGHFSNFSVEAGRALYRWKVNRLLEGTGDPLRLADEGEDIGRLVHGADGPRTELVERALSTRESEAARRVSHAIALFRRRGATEQDTRSAIVALAQVLEERRQLLKTSLFSDDEGALFAIANRFDLRHRNERQHTDYDPAFRDWVFWWYLATVELTDRLLARQTSAAAGRDGSPRVTAVVVHGRGRAGRAP